MRKYTLLFLLTSIILVSCFKDEYDFQNVSIENYNPTIAAPLVNSTLTLDQLIQNVDTNLISTNDDNLLQITFSDTILSYNVTELVSIPEQTIDQEFNIEPFSFDDLSNNSAITLGEVANNMAEPERTTILSNDGNSLPFPAVPSQSAGAFSLSSFSQFSSVTFSQGTLTITIDNNWPIDLTNLSIEIRNDGNNALIGTFNYPSIPAGTSASDNVDLTGSTMENTLRADITNLESPGTGLTPVLIQLASTLDVTASTSNLEVISGAAIFPDQDIITQTMEIQMNMENGEELRTLRLNAGAIDYNINFGLRENAQITISMPYVTNGGTPLTEVINITSDHINSQVISGSIPLDGYEFDLTSGGGNTNYIAAEISASIISSGEVIPFDTSDAVVAELSINNLDIQFLDGYLGNITQNIDPDTLSMTFFQNDLTNSISVADPQLNLRLNSSIGIPVAGDFSQIASYNEQGAIYLTGIPTPFSVNYPAYGNFTGSEITDIELNANNSNIGDIFNSTPDGIIYAMQIETNPNGDTGELNFITDESKIDVTMDVTVPIYGAVSGYEIIDTIEFPYEAFDNIKEGVLRTHITNEFPVDVGVQLYFTEENYTMIDSLFNASENVVSSSIIDGDGELVSSTEKTTDFDFPESKVNEIRNARYVIIAANLQTANGGADNAKFYAHYELDLKLGIKSTVQFNFQP